ncbi:hypothetical protein RYX36_035842 [Vicia faba]
MALHCGSFCFTSVASSPVGSVKFCHPIVKASVLPSPLCPPNVRLNAKGMAKAITGDGRPDETKELPLVVCFGEMLIDFVPTVSGLSLADASAFKKAPGGAPANVAVGIARLGGSSAFIGKVGEDELEICC